MKVHITNCFKRIECHYTNLIADAFESLGHEVFRFDDQDYPSNHLKFDKFIRRSPFFLLANKKPEYFDFKHKYRKFIGDKWLKTVEEFKPDFLLIINTGWLPQSVFKEAKETLKIKNIACWVVDNPNAPASEEMVNFLPYCDRVFIVDRGWIPFANFFNENINYLPLASSNYCFKPLNIEKDLDFSFTGSFFKNDPAGFFRALTISNIPKKYKVEVYGPGIDYFKNIYPNLNNFNCYEKYISVSNLNKLWNRSKSTVAVYHPQVIEGTAPRVFDAASSKTFQLIQYTDSINELFPGIENLTFKSMSEFSKKLDYYLNHQKEREEIAQMMYETAKNKHLFINRIKNMLEIMNLF